MKRLLTIALLGAAGFGHADEIGPAVRTSTAAEKPGAGVGQAALAGPAPARPAPARPAAAPARAQDRIDLDATQITGNRELPNVMYVVPWKRPDLGDFAGRPPRSLLDELLAPVDREVFRRQNRYFAALQPDAAAPPAAPAPVPAAGAATALPAGDEK